ncbi:MAG: hypothetical protein ACJAYC_001983 [Halieaceae bacterium]|jgi:hypothetical protein
MSTSKYAVLATLAFGLAGCQTAPPIATPEPQICPVIEAVSCPACEVQQCPEPEVIVDITTECKPAPPTACVITQTESKYISIGEREWALVEPSDLVLEARIDTGAATSSLHAEDIQLIEKDGKRWVRFNLIDPDTAAKIPIERRLHRRIRVKHNADNIKDRRYVVRMWVTLGETRVWLDVSLTDRDNFEFPVLIGRNMLVDNFTVDVSTHHTLPKPKPETEEQ